MSEDRMTVGGSADITGITCPEGQKYIRAEDADELVKTVIRTEDMVNQEYVFRRVFDGVKIYTPAEIMAGQWVPVTERLPEPLVEVLALYGNGEISIDWLDYDGNFLFANLFDGVTHWMPLPPLPQPPGEVTNLQTEM